MSLITRRAIAPLAIVLGLLTLGSGCCSPCGAGRPLTSYNYNPVYPTAYNPGYTSQVTYGAVAPVQTGCSSCGVAPF